MGRVWCVLFVAGVVALSQQTERRAPQGWWQQEDARYRSAPEVLPYGLEQIRALHPYRFRERLVDGAEVPNIGLMAQEVASMIPEAVRPPTQPSGAWCIDYSRLVTVLIRAVQELDTELQRQEAAALREELRALRQEVAQLRAELQRLRADGGVAGIESRGWLGEPHPNPFDRSTVVPYGVAPTVQRVELVVRSVLGDEIRRYLLSERQGEVMIQLDGAASGVYHISLVLDGITTETKTIQYVK